MSSDPIVKYTEAPILNYEMPTCDACGVEVNCPDSDGWECPMCRTTWGMDDYDRTGTLYEEWSGETSDMDPVDHEAGYRIAQAEDRKRRDACVVQIMAKYAPADEATS